MQLTYIANNLATESPTPSSPSLIWTWPDSPPLALTLLSLPRTQAAMRLTRLSSQFPRRARFCLAA